MSEWVEYSKYFLNNNRCGSLPAGRKVCALRDNSFINPRNLGHSSQSNTKGTKVIKRIINIKTKQ